MRISTFRSLLMLICFGLSAVTTLYAQATNETSATELQISLGAQRVRFVPQRNFQEMRLEVLNSTGESVFSYFTTEAAFEWNLRASSGETLPPGLYRYALTLKFAEEQTRQHTGHFIVEKGQDQLWLTANDGAEISGTALHATRTGRRSLAGLGQPGEASARREVNGRDLTDNQGKALNDEKKSANQSKANVLATANQLAKFAADGVTLIDSTVTETSGNVGIGATNPNAKLSVNANTGAPPSEVGIVGYFANANENNTFITADSYGNGPWHSDFLFRRARGTMAAPAAIQNDDIIGQIQARGYGATSFAPTSRAGIRMTAAQNWTNLSQGAYLSFLTTPNGSNAINLERMRLTDAGFLGLNTTAPSARFEVVKSSAAEDATIAATAYGDDNAVIGRVANGTAQAPTATTVNRSLLFLGGRGHTGAGFTFSRVGIHLAANENWNSTDNGTRITFETTLNGSLTRQERMRIDHNGNVGIGTTTPGSRLEVAGAIGANFQYNLNGDRVLHNSGTANLYAGVRAGAGAATGANNAFFGHEAGQLNIAGSRNAFFGAFAGRTTIASDNTFMGYLAGTANTGGSSNTFIGRSAGESNTDGTFNTFVGLFAGQSNTLNAANTFVGSSAGLNSTGQFNSFFGTNAGTNNTNGDRNTIIGSSANVASGNLSYATAIGAGATVSNSNTLVLGRAADTVRMPGDVIVEGTLEADYFGSLVHTFTVETDGIDVHSLSEGGASGHVCYGGETQALLPCFSTRRMKEQIHSFNAGLSVLQRLRPVTFNWKKTNQPDIGLIAEEVAEVEPRLANYNQKTGEVAGVKYDQITAVLINAVKEQQTQIAAQQRQIASLKKLVLRTQKRVTAWQSMKRKQR